MLTNSPIIIGGCPRSGTSLLRSCLNSHSNIFAGPECAMGLKAAEAVIEADKHIGERAYKAFNLSEDDFLHAYGLSYDYILHRMLEQSETNKPRIADKMPQNNRHFGMMSYMLPHAKFVHIIRDPRDVASSLLDRSDMFGYDTGEPVEFCKYADKAAEYWAHEVGLGLRMRQHPNAIRYYELQYEDLAMEPRKTLKFLLEWLDEPWDENVLHPDDGGLEWTNGDTNQTPHSKSVGRYVDRLTNKQVTSVENVARPLMERLGYIEKTITSIEE